MPLANALEVWLTEACATIAERIGELVHTIGMPRWEALASGGFRRYPYFATYRYSIFEAAIFTENSSWNAVERAAEAHENMKRHLDVLISTPDGSGSSWSLQELCSNLIPTPVLNCQNTIYIETDIDIKGQVLSLIQEINSEFISTTTIWPIYGTSVEAPLYLDELTEFRELNEAEKKHVLNFRIIDITHQDSYATEQSRWYGLCRKSMSKKIFGNSNLSLSNFQNYYLELDQTLEDFLVSASLVKDRVVSHAGGVNYAPNFELGGRLQRGVLGRGTGSASVRFLFSDDDQRLRCSEANKLCEVWSYIRGNSVDPFRKRVTNAARRLYYAETRIKKEDALVDLMIAAESIYLSTDTNELSYRISLNAALWADTNGGEQHKIFNNFRKAYNLRSKIVHGSTASTELITEAISFIKPVLTDAVQKALGQLSQNAGAPEWEKMIFEKNEIDPVIEAPS
jgi:hypothetical protein